MSSNGHDGIVVTVIPMTRGATFDWHSHHAHQLAWASSGVLTVSTAVATWVLPPTRALWIPAELTHEVRAASGATMAAAYLEPARCAVSWRDPTPVRAGALFRALIAHLEDTGLTGSRRDRAEAMLADILQPVQVATIDLRMPTDPRALQVAHDLCADPGDAKSLPEWGRHVGASSRTLARTFLLNTGVPFGRWRTLVRLHAALPLLAAGDSVATVSRAVGYGTPSAFVAAFRRETGSTPGSYRGRGTSPPAPPALSFGGPDAW